jgi:hypothetical protein
MFYRRQRLRNARRTGFGVMDRLALRTGCKARRTGRGRSQRQIATRERYRSAQNHPRAQQTVCVGPEYLADVGSPTAGRILTVYRWTTRSGRSTPSRCPSHDHTRMRLPPTRWWLPTHTTGSSQNVGPA